MSIGGADWSYRGYVSNSHPSDVLPLSWPEPDASTQQQLAGLAALPPGFAQVRGAVGRWPPTSCCINLAHATVSNGPLALQTLQHTFLSRPSRRLPACATSHEMQVGVSVEPLAELAQKEGSKLGAKEVRGAAQEAQEQ